MNDIRKELKDYRSKGSDVLENLYAAKKEIEQKIHIFNVFTAISSLKEMISEFKEKNVHSMRIIHGKYSNGDPKIDLILVDKKGDTFYEHDPDFDPLKNKVISILNKIDRNLDLFHPLYIQHCTDYSFRLTAKGLDHLQEAFLNDDLDKIVSHALLHEKLNDKEQKEPSKLKI